MNYTEIIHFYGQHACGKPAFLYRTDKLVRGQSMASEHALTLDGQAIDPGAACICGACGRAFHPWIVRGAEHEIS